MTDARRVVIASFAATPGERFERLRDLVASASSLGWEPDVLLVAGGEGLADLRRTVPVNVADEYRRRGLGALPTALGWTAPGRWLKRTGLRRWTRARSEVPWLVADPSAWGLVRYAQGRHGAIAVVLAAEADPVAQGHGEVSPAVWVVGTPEQAASLATAGGPDVVVVGSLAEPDRSVVAEATWPLLLLPTAGAWSEVNHTIEVAEALARRHPSVPLHWMVRSKEDEWLARFDLDKFCLADRVTTVWPAEAPIARYRMVIRTGYGPSERDRCHDARTCGIPVVGFEPEDRGEGAVAPLPFDVEGLLAEVDRVLPDEGSIRVRERRYEEAAAAQRAATAALATVLDALSAGR